VTTLEYNPQNLALASGCSDGTVHYWDLEKFKRINVTNADTSAVSHLTFSDLNAEHLFAASAQNLRVMNIENNFQLDCIQTPPKEVTDLKISYQRRYLLMSCIQSNTLSVYYQSLDHINFDETVDTIPSQGVEEPKGEK
jgi:WD40 repeat protein